MHFLKPLFCVVGFLAAFSQLYFCAELLTRASFTGDQFDLNAQNFQVVFKAVEHLSDFIAKDEQLARLFQECQSKFHWDDMKLSDKFTAYVTLNFDHLMYQQMSNFWSSTSGELEVYEQFQAGTKILAFFPEIEDKESRAVMYSFCERIVAYWNAQKENFVLPYPKAFNVERDMAIIKETLGFYFLVKKSFELVEGVFNRMDSCFRGPARNGSLIFSFVEWTSALNFGSSGCLVNLYHFSLVFSEKFPGVSGLAKKNSLFQFRFILQLYSDMANMLLELSETTSQNAQVVERLRYANAKFDLALAPMDKYKCASLSTRKAMTEIRATYIDDPRPMSFPIMEGQYRSSLDKMSKGFSAFIEASCLDAINAEKRVVLADLLRKLKPLLLAHLFPGPSNTANTIKIIPARMLLLNLLQSSGISKDFPNVNLSLLPREFDDALLGLQFVVSLSRKYDALITQRLAADFAKFQKDATAMTTRVAFFAFLEHFWPFVFAYTKGDGPFRQYEEDPQLTKFFNKIVTADFPRLNELSGGQQENMYWTLFEGLKGFVQPRSGKASDQLPAPLQEAYNKMNFIHEKFRKAPLKSEAARDPQDNLVTVYLGLIKSAAVEIIRENTVEFSSVIAPLLTAEAIGLSPALMEALEKYLPLAADLTPGKIYMLFFLADRSLLLQSMVTILESTPSTASPETSTAATSTTSTNNASSLAGLYCLKDVSIPSKKVHRLQESTKKQVKSQFKYYSSIYAEFSDLLGLPASASSAQAGAKESEQVGATESELDESLLYMSQSNDIDKKYLGLF